MMIRQKRTKEVEKVDEYSLNFVPRGERERQTEYAYRSDGGEMMNEISLAVQRHQNGAVSKEPKDPQEEMRHTLKKVPKISGKFPAAFNEILPKGARKPHNDQRKPKDEPENPKFIPSRHRQYESVGPQNNLLEDLNKMVSKQEYKKVQNLLSPLKKHATSTERDYSFEAENPNGNDMTEKNVRGSQDTNGIAGEYRDKRKSMFHNQKGGNKLQADNNINNNNDGKISRERNPLLPLKRYLILSKKNGTDANEQMGFSGQGSELDIDVIQKLRSKQTEMKHLVNSPFKLEEMLTLSLLKSTRYSGSVKKMLHVPTLRLMAIKEEPVSTREIRQTLREWITLWQNIPSPKYLLKVQSTFWNTPEGCVSIVMDYINGGSLQNLLESVGSLPEGAIVSIASQLLHGVDELHTKGQTPHGAIAPTQVLLTRKGGLKLGLGVSFRMMVKNINPLASVTSPVADKLHSLYESSLTNIPILLPLTGGSLLTAAGQEEQKRMEFAHDIFQVGYLMLICAIGGLDILDVHDVTYERIKQFVAETEIANPQKKLCCLLHSPEFFNYFGGDFQKDTFGRKKQGTTLLTTKAISIDMLLISNQKFSNEFRDFLCQTLRFDPAARPNPRTLLEHPFFTKKKELKNADISLEDLLGISSQWSRQGALPFDHRYASEKQLEKIYEGAAVVLQNCEQYFKLGLISGNVKNLLKRSQGKPVESIEEIAEDLGISKDVIAQKLADIFSALPSLQPRDKYVRKDESQ